MSTITKERVEIETPYGVFEVRDVRTPNDGVDDFAYLYPVGGEFTINRKTYKGYLRLSRSYNGESLYVIGEVGDDRLSESASEKLEQALAVLHTEYPPFTHEEKVAFVLRRALDKADLLVGQILDAAISEAMRKYDLDPYYPTWPEGRERLTAAELEEIRAAVKEAVKAQVAAL